MTGASSWHIANLEQSILETFDIYGLETTHVGVGGLGIGRDGSVGWEGGGAVNWNRDVVGKGDSGEEGDESDLKKARFD
jgi:hypothetical protein